MMQNTNILCYLFFPNLATIAIIITATTIAINIPKPIPTLKMPFIASQEVNKKGRMNSIIILIGFTFFMCFILN